MTKTLYVPNKTHLISDIKISDIAIIIGSLSTVLIFASLFSLVNASTVEHLLVGSGQQETVPINLLAPQTVTGSLNISGIERNDTVNFWVRTPNGATILDAETTANGKNFTFTASSDGEYVLNFKKPSCIQRKRRLGIFSKFTAYSDSGT